MFDILANINISDECADRSTREEERISNLKTNLKLKKWQGSPKKTEKLLNESQLIINYLTKEVSSLKSEIEFLKSKKRFEKETLIETEINRDLSAGIYSAEEVAKMYHMNKLLKVEHDLFRLENTHLKNKLKKDFESRLDQQQSQKNVNESLHAAQCEEIRKLKKDQSINTKKFSSRVNKLQNSLKSDKEIHKNKVEKLNKELLRLLNIRNRDLTSIFESLKLMQRDYQRHIWTVLPSNVADAISANNEVIARIA